jgi:hypothetical protein
MLRNQIVVRPLEGCQPLVPLLYAFRRNRLFDLTLPVIKSLCIDLLPLFSSKTVLHRQRTLVRVFFHILSPVLSLHHIKLGAFVSYRMAVQAPTLYTCPPLGSSISFHETYVRLAHFSGDLCTLSEIVGGTAIKPIARAFDGRDWQVSAGEYAGVLTIECDPSTHTCDMILPPLHEDDFFRLTSYEKYVDPNNSSEQPSIVARLLPLDLHLI